MNLSFKHLLDPGFHPRSKVWVYQASRVLTLGEAFEAEDLIKSFTAVWLSHGDAVKAEGHLFFGQFVVLIADESQTHVGGCSTDSSVRFIKTLEQKFEVNFFDRTALAFVIREHVEVLPYAQLQYAVDHGFIAPETLYFNNLVTTLEELKDRWIIPLKDSWLASKIKLPGSAEVKV